MYRVIHDVDPSKYSEIIKETGFPSFIISVAGPYFPKMQVDYKDSKFTQEAFTFPVESAHIYGKQDEYFAFMNEHKLYTKDPLVIMHEEGHKFPRALSDEDFSHLKAFVQKQYDKKFTATENQS